MAKGFGLWKHSSIIAAGWQDMIYDITPVPKPRQTQADKWKKRPAVMRYRAFADEVRLKKVYLPTERARVIFHIPMPKSWSKKKKTALNHYYHQQINHL